MDSINAESVAVLESEDLGTITNITAVGNINFDTTSADATTPITATSTIPTGWVECNGQEAQIGEIVFANGSVIYTSTSEEPIPYRITGEVTNVIIA